MKVINGDILDFVSGIICHQVNCKGVMGAGIALKIRNKWPHVYTDYRRMFEEGLLWLGNVLTSEITPEQLYVAHLCGQDRYGRDKRYTDYVALAACMTNLAAYHGSRKIYMPYNMGCVNAGGDWKIVSDMIDHLIPDAVVVKLG